MPEIGYGIKGCDFIYKKDFIEKVTQVLYDNNMMKYLKVPNANITVSNDDGDAKTLSVRIPNRRAYYSKNDVLRIFNACLAVIEDCLKRGEELTVLGVGTLGVKYRAPRMVKRPLTEEWCNIPGHYVPHFQFGSSMRTAVKIYEANMSESKIDLPEPVYELEDMPIELAHTLLEYTDEYEDDEDGEYDGE